MWTFGLTVSLEWWKWFLMLLGGGFCVTFGSCLANHAYAWLSKRG